MSDAQKITIEPLTDWRPHNPWLIALTVMLATFMEVLDTSIANVALPHIAGNLSATIDESTWVLTSYLVSNAIMLPLSGWFSMLLGRKKFFIICVVIFTVSSFLCGLAPNIEMLVLFRIIQGAGGGALQPLAQSILIENFPPIKRGMAMAVYGMGVVVAPIVGPTLGGWITDNYSWRWIFYINIPVGMLSVFLTTLLVHDPPHFIRKSFKTGLKIDYIGLGLISVGLGSLQIMLDKGEREDWFSSHFIITFAVLAALCLLAAIVWEWRRKEPVIDLHLLKDRNFSIAVFLMFILGVVLYGSTVLLPLFLQTVLGYSALDSGLAMSPGAIVTLATMPLIGLLLTKYQPRWLIVFGLTVGTLGLYIMTTFNLQVSFWHATLSRIVLSGALGFLFIPINTAAYYYIAKTKVDSASGLINLARNIGGSVGISFVTTMLSRQSQVHQNFLVGNVNEYNPHLRQMLSGATKMLMEKGSSTWEAAIQAKILIYGMVKQQAVMLAFIDNSWILATLFVTVIPLVFLLKKTLPHKNDIAIH
jgi:MFS transporter, DHA2 family, multidrug resistance protein